MSEPKLQVGDSRVGRVRRNDSKIAGFRVGDYVVRIDFFVRSQGPWLDVAGLVDNDGEDLNAWMPAELRHATDVEILAAKLEGHLNEA